MNEEIFTRNMTVDSMLKLEIDWATTITIENVLSAYSRFVDLNTKMIGNGIVPTFDIDDKKRACDYLLKLIQRKEG